MEWFQRPDGDVAIGEIAQRPPGGNITAMIGYAHGVDPYRAWARAVVDGELDAHGSGWRLRRPSSCEGWGTVGWLR